ncbi:MAG: hypothetical protein D6812_10610 [Deltaproteobacteria bacterium]|nr:MAG: hypothetical protein D6812_10610 [Deltaproteobacteria bacterium]
MGVNPLGPILILPCVLLLLLLAGGCTARTGTLRVFRGTKLELPHLHGTAQVEGKDCAMYLFLLKQSPPRLDRAISDALDRAGRDFNALAEVEVTERHRGFLGSGRECIVVRGWPLKIGGVEPKGALYGKDAIPPGTKPEDWAF